MTDFDFYNALSLKGRQLEAFVNTPATKDVGTTYWLHRDVATGVGLIKIVASRRIGMGEFVTTGCADVVIGPLLKQINVLQGHHIDHIRALKGRPKISADDLRRDHLQLKGESGRIFAALEAHYVNVTLNYDDAYHGCVSICKDEIKNLYRDLLILLKNVIETVESNEESLSVSD